MQKLKAVEDSLASLEEKAEAGSQLERNEAQKEIFDKWDVALNEVYGAL